MTEPSSDEGREGGKRQPGDAIPSCEELPNIRARAEAEAYRPNKESAGYTSPGYIEHFLPDREVNLAKLNRALQDVFGEPGLRGMRVELEIDEAYWRQICGDPWSGNIYRYNF